MVYYRPAQPVARGQHAVRESVMLPAEPFGIRDRTPKQF
jgi:hypothetical protein